MKNSVLDFIESRKSLIRQNNPDTVFLIGGGKSLLQYLPDKSILNNQNVITANDGYLLYPNAIACHFADWVWFTWNRDQLLPLCNTNNITNCSNHNHEYYRGFYNSMGITMFSKGDNNSLTRDINYLNGNNTGHQIINLAYHIGFKNIILLGYDLIEEAKTHWHNNHRRPTNIKNLTEVMLPAFNTLHDGKQKYDINIININKQSALKCFEYGEIEDFIK